MSDVAIRVESISKLYRLQQGRPGGMRYRALRDVLTDFFARPFRPGQKMESQEKKIDFWALKDITFEVKCGEVIGLVGRNGAGKSTLLKVLSRITEPTSGFAQIHGRVGSLLEVGTGFHPELSGRENIFLNGAILGMRRLEISRKFDEIVAFAEVDRFVDSPVKFYSSGMFVRLAFAVAAHLEPEILLVDEVLAVGDAAFQKKCLGKMGDVARSGRTVVLVSHNMGAVSELCTSGVLLNAGKVALIGKVPAIIEGYGSQLSAQNASITLEDSGGIFSILSAVLTNHNDVETRTFDLNESITLAITYRLREPLNGLVVASQFLRNFVDVFYTYDTDNLEDVPRREAGLYVSKVHVPARFLKAGRYTIRIAAGIPQMLLADHEGLLQFDIEELTENTHERAYRLDRPGHVIFPGRSEIQRIE